MKTKIRLEDLRLDLIENQKNIRGGSDVPELFIDAEDVSPENPYILIWHLVRIVLF